MTGVLATTVLGWELSLDAAIIGASSGLTYALLGAGLVLIFRATGVLNFAHGEVGALAGAVLGRLVLQDGWNYWLTLVLCTAIGVAVGALTDLLIMRRLAKASRLALLAATLGLAQLLLVAQTFVPRVELAAPYPAGLDAEVTIAGVTLFGQHIVALVLVPVLICALGLFLTRTSFGLAIRASADNESAARLAGMSPRRVSLMVWSIAGGLSAVTFVLNAPIKGTISGVVSQGLGPNLLLRALAAALVGRFVSLPLTLAGGVVIGVIEAQAFINVPPGTVDAVIFAVVAVLVVLRIRDTDASAAITATAGAPPISTWLSPVPRRGAAILGVGAVVALPFVIDTPSQQALFSRVAIYALVAVSVVVVTGWSGQLSLCQFAFVGVGALVTYALTTRGMGYGWACLYAACAGVVASLLVGVPALRVKGLFLAVTTLGFAIAAQGWLLPHPRLAGESTSAFVPRGRFGPFDLASQRTFYFVVLVVVAAMIAAVVRLRASGIGRSILAVRENERSAEAMSISTVRTKVLAFGLAGGLAAVAGALLAGLEVQFQATDFAPAESLQVLAMAIIGGVGSVSGAVIGAVFVLGIPAVIGDTSTVRLLTGGIGLLAILLIEPGGLLELFRRGAARIAVRTKGEEAVPADAPDVAADVVPATAAPVEPVPAAARIGDVILSATGVEVRFGGLRAVQGVELEAREGEVVGLIGTNGAGKSTLLNAINGFVSTEGGTITFDGTAIGHLPPYQRSRLGIGRVFQDARVFPALTVREAIAVALEAQEASELVPSALWLPPSRLAEWRKRQRVDELVELLDLAPVADRLIAELSTGSRRMVEIACLLAVDARVLLLDEPMAGVAHQETQRFVELIQQTQRELGATVLIIEHDMSVIMTMSDRVYCMAAGQVIAHGDPEDVRADPAVIAAYLGGPPAEEPMSDASPPRRRSRTEPLVAR